METKSTVHNSDTTVQMQEFCSRNRCEVFGRNIK